MPMKKTLAALAAAFTIPLLSSFAQEATIEMRPVKYDGLKQEVVRHRGKVVVVDFWAGY